ncbi:MAG: class I adenylate-forming enzyme family protein, partial [Candidatus Hodarchaeales archaeon]
QVIDRLKTDPSVSEKLTFHGITFNENGTNSLNELCPSLVDSYSAIDLDDKDIWVILYTSGTTGKPKGVLRSHRSYISLFLTHQVEFGFTEDDKGLILMPLAHVNSTFYGFIFLYLGAFLYIHREYKFNAAELLEIIDREKITFISMIPTHYSKILALPDSVKNKYDNNSVKSLLTSSAPVCKEIKVKIMKYFKNTQLYEAYGSTEAGTITILKPGDQLAKLGSVGKCCYGSHPFIILDLDKKPVVPGEIGEIFSKSPMLFSGYNNLPEKTEEASSGGYFSSGDFGYQDEDGFLYIVDRKYNMIITGGEHVYPSEVEKVISTHPGVNEVAVIGTPHELWGEAVTALVIPNDSASLTEKEIIDFCNGKMDSYKKPKHVIITTKNMIPKTGSGKTRYRELREKWAAIINKDG